MARTPASFSQKKTTHLDRYPRSAVSQFQRNHHIYMRTAVSSVLLVAIAAFSAVAQTFPESRGYMNDLASIIDDSTEARIRSIAEAVEAATSIEMAVATVPSMAPYESIEEYSIALATVWQIGKAGKDNGLLIVVALQER